MTEVVAAFPDVQVAVADAGGFYPDQHLRARGLRRWLVNLPQRRVEIGDLETLHDVFPGEVLAVAPDIATPCCTASRKTRGFDRCGGHSPTTCGGAWRCLATLY